MFHEWELTQASIERDAAQLVADIGAILDWMPAEARPDDPDPEKLGVRKMIDALGRLSGSQ